MSAGDVLSVAAGELDETYIGTRAMITTPAGTFAGGISDVVQRRCGERVFGFAGRNRPVELRGPATELWLGGHGMLVPPSWQLVVEPSPSMVQAAQVSEAELDAEHDRLQRRLAGGRDGSEVI